MIVKAYTELHRCGLGMRISRLELPNFAEYNNGEQLVLQMGGAGGGGGGSYVTTNIYYYTSGNSTFKRSLEYLFQSTVERIHIR